MNDSIVIDLLHAARRIENRVEEALAAVQLSGSKYAALKVLILHDQPLTLSELAEELTCVRSNVTQLVDRLEADGLVQRTDDPADRRAVRAEVTKLGRQRHLAGEKVLDKVLQEIEDRMSAAEIKALQRTLAAIG